jgi:hypothetical protein
MTRLRLVAAGQLALGLGVGLAGVLPARSLAARDLPAQLGDREFWALTEQLSEPEGFFRSDNLVSDELIFSAVVPALRQRVAPGGVYLGVGPEQNFTYIAAIRPRMAFIIDIRRGNLHLQLLYKALFELSATRAEFVSRLFTKPQPASLSSELTARALMDAYWTVKSSDAATYERNLQEVDDVLVRKHGFPLTQSDLEGIRSVYHAFYWQGPNINWSSSLAGGAPGRSPAYFDVMTQRDATTSSEFSYLATDAAFAEVKDLESRNALIPVVGNFAGPKAIRAVGNYLRSHQATVGVFYVDEVEPYLRQDGVWSQFCANVATLPLDSRSLFIRPRPESPDLGYFSKESIGAFLVPIAPEVRACTAGH